MSHQYPHYLEKIDIARISCLKEAGGEHIAHHAHRHYKKGQYIYLPGERAERVYFLAEGRVKAGAYESSGKEFTKRILSPGEPFGERALLGEINRRDFAFAMEDSVACVISVADMRSMMQENNALSIFLMKTMGSRMLEMEQRLESLIFKDSRTRVIEFLYELGVKKGQRVGYEMLVRQFMTHQEIANLAATSRQTVTSVLNELRNRNLLAFNRKRLLIRDMKKLAEAGRE